MRSRSQVLVIGAVGIACFFGATLASFHVLGRVDRRAHRITREIVPAIEQLAELRSRLLDLEMAFRGGPAPTLALQVAIRETSALAGDAIQRHARTTATLASEISADRRRGVQWALLLDILSALFTAVAAGLVVRALARHERIERRSAELLARRADELERFATRVAHDIVGPLHVTRLSLDLIGAQPEPPSPSTVERARRGIDRAATIVEGLLLFARAGAGPDPDTATTVAPVVADVIAELTAVARAAGVELVVAPVPGCSVGAHPGVLTSIVENLVRNAVKYMGDRTERRVELRVIASARSVRIEVEDTGPGIAPSLVDSIFDPHVRGDRSQPGLGLGLATVRRLVEAHGGRCELCTRLGAGSTFAVELPRVDGRSATGDPRGRAAAAQLREHEQHQH